MKEEFIPLDADAESPSIWIKKEDAHLRGQRTTAHDAPESRATVSTEEKTELGEWAEQQEEQRERARTKRRNALGERLEDDQRFIALLLEHLSSPDLPQDEQAVVVRMLQRTYISMLDRVEEFKLLDGSLYSVNYGLLRRFFERD